MKRPLSPGLWLAPAAALVLPPLLLVPMQYHVAQAQLFKDGYEACLWLSPAIGVVVLGVLGRLKWTGAASFREPVMFVALLLAALDLASPLFFYVLLAILAGH